MSWTRAQAHVLAKLAGYRVVELNASDDRSAAALEQAVGNGMSNRTLETRDERGGLSATSRPTCVVLDELDGADGKTAIDVLVRMAKQPLPAKREKHDRTKPRRRSDARADDAAGDAALDDDDDDDDDDAGDGQPRAGAYDPAHFWCAAFVCSFRRERERERRQRYADASL